MPNSPRKNCPTLTIAIYHLKPWTWVLTQFWTFEIISINKKVTAFQTEVVFSFFVISSKLPGWILGTLRGPKKKIFFLLICMAMSYNILNFEPNRWLCRPKSVTIGMHEITPYSTTFFVSITKNIWSLSVGNLTLYSCLNIVLSSVIKLLLILAH